MYLPVQCCYLLPTDITDSASLELVSGDGSRAGLLALHWSCSQSRSLGWEWDWVGQLKSPRAAMAAEGEARIRIV